MARIAGIDVPRDKRIDVSLRYIYGIGPTTAADICEQAHGGYVCRMLFQDAADQGFSFGEFALLEQFCGCN